MKIEKSILLGIGFPIVCEKAPKRTIEIFIRDGYFQNKKIFKRIDQSFFNFGLACVISICVICFFAACFGKLYQFSTIEAPGQPLCSLWLTSDS